MTNKGGILMAPALLLLLVVIPSAFAQQQYINYTDPNSKWSIQYPSHWLVTHSNSQTINESKFIPFNDANVSIRIGASSNLSSFAMNYGMRGQWYCNSYFIEGYPTCTIIGYNNATINNMVVSTTINGNDYAFKLHVSNQTEFEEKLPVFMQMLTTFKVN